MTTLTGATVRASPESPRRRVLVTGASGMIGRAVVTALRAGGHDALRAVRRPPRAPDEVAWDPERGLAPNAALEGLDGVVHLAGENLSAGRWTPSRLDRIRRSRVQSTRLLAQSLAALTPPTRAFVGASAIGWYGSPGDEVVTEDRPAAGDTVLGAVVRDWEQAADPARAAGIRVVHLRQGLVLSPTGGVLQRLLLPFRLGLGGPIADGQAWWSWIALDDVVGLFLSALEDSAWTGAYNATSPEPVRNSEFTRVLARVLNRPAVLPVPAFALRLAFGAMADETILTSVRASSARAQASGYRFRFSELEGALRHVLGHAARQS